MEPLTPEEQEEITLELFKDEGKYVAFFQLYSNILHLSSLFRAEPYAKADLTHRQVKTVMSLLKDDFRSTRTNLTDKAHQVLGGRLATSNVAKLVSVGVQATIMLDPDAKNRHAHHFGMGTYRPTDWLPNETLLEFVDRSFDRTHETSPARMELVLQDKAALKAWKLQSRLGIEFHLTNNLAEHLLYDRHGNSLYLFHQIAFLKAQLRIAKDQSLEYTSGPAASFEKGVLPPQLLAETLHSFQDIIFPTMDRNSALILDRLISRCDFDSEGSQYDGYMLSLPNDFKYDYWGERIVLLYDLLEQRPPRNRLERWFKWQSTDANALFIALVALLISVIVGIISICLSGVQIWIGWMAWKHPTSS
ncbi:hypothetical protein F5B20DRAFT_470609 [Whalleya microplaca]|nr:hypothetical protein F5B20DRAFT_470609 [Whalleya microplaca]